MRLLLVEKGLQEKTRGNFYKKQKGRRFYAAAFDKTRIFYFFLFSFKIRK